MADREKIIRYYKGTEGADTAVRLVDIAEQTMKNRKFRQSDFLDPYGIEIAETVAANYEGLRVDFSGGYPGAERQRAIFVHEDFMGQPFFDLEVVKASEIEPKEVKWLWYPYIPFGKVTLLQGDPGDGKSKLMLSIAALLSKGEALPFTDEEVEPMTIIYQTTEDDADDTVVPRFNSAGGNGENLIFIKEDEKSLSFGDNRIAEAIEKYHAKLLILDPMSSYIGESCSMNNANETRAEFNHLIAVAKDTGCAIVIIAHMNKMRDTNPLYRTNGSIDIAGAARSILAITRTPNKEVPAERYLVQVKSNLAPTGSAILFEVSEKGVDFISEMEMTAEEAFQSLAPKIGRPNDKEVKAKAFLIEMLKDGEMLSSDCEEKLEAAGFRKSTIKKAKKNAGVISRKKGFLWYWSLPMGDIPRE